MTVVKKLKQENEGSITGAGLLPGLVTGGFSYQVTFKQVKCKHKSYRYLKEEETRQRTWGRTTHSKSEKQEEKQCG
jgi:hypothetical protein